MSNFQLGSRVRGLRTERKLSLRALSKLSGISVAMLSQIENDQVEPSLASLRKLATVFNESIATLFLEPLAPAVHISRLGERMHLNAPKGEVKYQRLTPGRGDLEVVYAEFMPGDCSSSALWSHASTECAYVLNGTICIEIGDEKYMLEEGEAITFDSLLPHRYVNSSAKNSTLIISITPPSP